MTTTEDRVKKLLSDHLGIDLNKITVASTILDELGADSLDQIEIVMALEEEFNLEISDDDGIQMVTVQDIVRYVDLACEAVRA